MRWPQRVHAIAGRHPFITMPPGLAQYSDGDLDIGTVDQAGGNRLLDTQVRAGSVSDRRNAGAQCQPQVACGLKEPQRKWRLDEPQGVNVVEHDVHVAVDKAGDHKVSRGIDRGVTVQTRAYIDNPLALDEHVRGSRGPVNRVKDVTAANQQSRRHFSPAARRGYSVLTQTVVSAAVAAA